MSTSASPSHWVRPALGALAGLGAAAAIAVLPWLAWPQIAPAPASVEIVPQSTGQTLVCPGDLLAPARDSTQVAELSAAAVQEVVTAGDAAIERRDLSSDAEDLRPLVLSSAAGAVPFAAAGSSSVAAADLAGFSAAACRIPLLDSWLVAGAGVTESADFVVLGNPGEVAATVTLTVYGAAGPEVPPGGADIVVRAGSQQIVPLAGLALGEESPVIHVQATGAPVAASVQSSVTRTLDPGGVDQAGAIAAVDTALRIPGVAVTRADGGAGTGQAPTAVRLLSPIDAGAATITVRAVGQVDPVLAPTTVELPAGIPTVVEVPGLGVGTYVIDIESVQPIVAAAWQATGFAAPSDFAWYEPAPAIAQDAVIAVPAGPSPTLTITGSAFQEVVVELTEVGGSPVPVTIPAGSSAQIPVRANAAYVLTGGPVTASVGYAAPDALASFPVQPGEAGREGIVVFP